MNREHCRQIREANRGHRPARYWLFFLVLVAVISPLYGGPVREAREMGLDEHGTCATVVLGKPGIAFIIDSRITQTLGGKFVGQHPGCKVLLARPTILLAGVGLEDTTGNAGHWNSLDSASATLNSLPENPTETQIDAWGDSWQRTLVSHFRTGGEKPADLGVVSEVLLVTKVGGLPYFERVTVLWNGSTFEWTIFGRVLNDEIPNVQYSGVCRDFVGHSNYDNERMPPKYARTSAEEERLKHWGNRKIHAMTITDLADAAYGFESVLTDIDERLEGGVAVIGRPFASAEWSRNAKSWITSFNDECKPMSTPVPETKTGTIPLGAKH